LSHDEVFETGRLVERRLAGVVERLVVWISTLMEAEA
jgi:hypothetical protein